MNTKILIVCLLVAGKDILVAGKNIEPLWKSFDMSEPHDIHYRIACCKNALEKREAVCYQIDATTQGWTDDQYEYELRNIREQAASVFSNTDNQRNLLSRVQQNPNNLNLVNQLQSSLTETVVSFLCIKNCFEKAQKERDARLD